MFRLLRVVALEGRFCRTNQQRGILALRQQRLDQRHGFARTFQGGERARRAQDGGLIARVVLQKLAINLQGLRPALFL